MFAKFLPYLLTLAVLTSCESKFYREASLRGKVIDERYYDPKGWFSVETSKFYQRNIEEIGNERVSGVIFYGELGGLKRFEASQHPMISEWAADAKQDRDQIKFMFYEAGLEPINESYPGTTILHEDFVTLDDNNVAYFVILNIPQGGSLMHVETKQHLDSTRGFLVYLDGHQLVSLSYEHSQIAVEFIRTYGKKTDGNKSEISSIILGNLLDMQKGYRKENRGI